MGIKTFNNYAILANSGLSYTQKAGRYVIQEESERLILPDVVSKLDLKSTDSLLEVGCGLGNVLIPLSYLAESATGIDHPDILDKLRERAPFQPLNLIGGNFLDIEIQDKFNKILVYSVLHCLSDFKEVVRFIEKAIKLISTGGRLLLGDIPNEDRKKRFMNSKEGKLFHKQWENMLHNSESGVIGQNPIIEEDQDLVSFDDVSILEILSFVRKSGFAAWIVPQPPELPFGRTREDILIVREFS